MKTLYAVTLIVPLIVVAGLGSVARGQPAAAPEDANALFRRAVSNIPDKPFVGTGSLSTGYLTRDAKVSHKKLANGNLGVYIEVTAPGDVKGTRFLFIDRVDQSDEQYIFVPKVGRVRRLTGSVDDQPFLGSEFKVSDLVNANPDDFTMAFIGDATIQGRKCRLVEAKKKDPATWGYGKAIYAIDPNDLLVMRIEFFDTDGKPVRVFTVDKVEKIDGIWTPRLLRAKNVKDDIESTLTISEVHYDVDLPDSLFTRANLEHE
jgi:hypothetical protein